jgi:hypothetical protein
MRAGDRRSFARNSWNDFRQTGVSASTAVRSRVAARGTDANEENDMKRIAAYLASAALGAALVGSGPAWAQIAWRYPYNPDNYAYIYGYPYSYTYGYGYPYNYAYGYANPFATVTAPIAALTAPVTAVAAPVAEVAAAPFAVATSATAPLVTGRSVATGQLGKMCSTPVKACELYHASYIGNGCSCRVTGGRSRGTVSP